jgi:hypothetical protein
LQVEWWEKGDLVEPQKIEPHEVFWRKKENKIKEGGRGSSASFVQVDHVDRNKRNSEISERFFERFYE